MTPFSYLTTVPYAVPKKAQLITVEPQEVPMESSAKKPKTMRTSILYYLADHGRSLWDDVFNGMHNRYLQRTFDNTVRAMRREKLIDVINELDGNYLRIKVSG